MTFVFGSDFLNASALIWVVDSNDLNRMNEAKAELMRNLREDQLKDSVLLVLANKQDLPDALSPDQLSEMLQLKELNWWKWKVVVNILFDKYPAYGSASPIAYVRYERRGTVGRTGVGVGKHQVDGSITTLNALLRAIDF